ncbi:MAG TPA: bacterial transcriptional activator domain-containing protein [Steroidobacteraceae bacterium]|jgi:LuxR family transcriptional regulator, maltose regulon positive regulatory protein
MQSPGAESWSIQVYALGRFEILLDGEPLRFRLKTPRKPLALLKSLLCGGIHGVSQSAVCDALWPEQEPWSATRSLHITAFRLRGLLRRKSAVVMDGGRVALDPELCWVDAWEFEHSVSQAKDPTALLWALRFYRGIFLSDSDHPFAIEARERLRRKFIRAVLQLGRRYEQIGDTSSAIDLYAMALDADATSEDVHRGLMRCLVLSGQFSAVPAAFQRCRAMLLRHFGTAPSPLTEQIYQQACAGAPGWTGQRSAAQPLHRGVNLGQ